MEGVCSKVEMNASVLLFKNFPSETRIETRLITLLSSKQEKRNGNVKLITLLSSKQEKRNGNAELITLLSSKQEKRNRNYELITLPSLK